MAIADTVATTVNLTQNHSVLIDNPPCQFQNQSFERNNISAIWAATTMPPPIKHALAVL